MISQLSTKFFVAIQHKGDPYATTVGMYISCHLALEHYKELRSKQPSSVEVILGMSSK